MEAMCWVPATVSPEKDNFAEHCIRGMANTLANLHGTTAFSWVQVVITLKSPSSSLHGLGLKVGTGSVVACNFNFFFLLSMYVAGF